MMNRREFLRNAGKGLTGLAVAPLLPATAERKAEIKRLILDRSLDPGLTVNTDQAAQAFELLAKIGVSPNEGGLSKI